MPSEQVHVEVLAAGPQKHISEPHRFALLVIGAYGCMCCSFSYAFNLISGAMQEKYNLSQRDLSTITTVGSIFQFFVLPYGFLYDYIGPIPICIILTTYFAFGSIMLALCFNGTVKGNTLRLCIFNAFLMGGCGLYDLEACVTVPSHFPTRKGAAAAVFKTMTGLGQAIVGSIYTAFFTAHTDKYFFFLMACATFVGILSISFMRLPPYHLTEYQQKHLSEDDIKRLTDTKTQYLRQEPPDICFRYGIAVLITLIVYLFVEGMLVNYLNLGSSYKTAFAIITIILTLSYMGVCVPLSFIAHSRMAHVEAEPIEIGVDEQILRLEEGKTKHNFSEERKDDTDHAHNTVTSNVPETEIDYIAPQYSDTFTEALIKPDIWVLWWYFFGAIGTEMIILFNATFIVNALAGKPQSDTMRSLLTILNGTGSASGRFLMASFETWSQAHRVEDRVPITISMFLPAILVTISTIMFAVLPSAALPLPCLLAAINQGSLFSAMMLIARTIFSKDVAKFYNFMFVAVATSAVALNRFLYGEWYTRQAEKQGNADKQCYGKNCLLMPLIFLIVVNVSTIFAAAFVHIRYNRFCKLVLEERARVREEAMKEIAEELYSHTAQDNINNERNNNRVKM